MQVGDVVKWRLRDDEWAGYGTIKTLDVDGVHATVAVDSFPELLDELDTLIRPLLQFKLAELTPK